LTDYLPQECLLSAVKGQREGDEGNQSYYGTKTNSVYLATIPTAQLLL
jgi:hypothetical protein